MDLAPLDRVGWLAEQSADFRAFVAETGRWETYRPGQFLYHSGDAADGIFGLASGAIEITFPLVAEEPVAVHRAEVGYWGGVIAALAQTPRIGSLMAVRESKVLHLPGAAMRALLAERPEHWRAFFGLAAKTFTTANTLLSEALALTVKARVCRRLLTLGERESEVAITQADLAKLVGVTRGTLQRCLSDLAERGAVEVRYGRLRVLDASVLQLFRDEQ